MAQGHIHSHSQPGSANNSNRNSATRTGSKNMTAGGDASPLSILPPSSTSPRSTVFPKASPSGTNNSTAGTTKRSSSGSGGAHSILKHHSRFGSGNHSPQIPGGTTVIATSGHHRYTMSSLDYFIVCYFSSVDSFLIMYHFCHFKLTLFMHLFTRHSAVAITIINITHKPYTSVITAHSLRHSLAVLVATRARITCLWRPAPCHRISPSLPV